MSLKFPEVDDLVQECRDEHASSVPCEEDINNVDQGKQLLVTWIQQGVLLIESESEDDLYDRLEESNKELAETIMGAVSHSKPKDHLDLDQIPMNLLLLLCARLYEETPYGRPWMQHGTMSDLNSQIFQWGGLLDDTHSNAMLIEYLKKGFKNGLDFDEHLLVRWPTVRNVADIATFKTKLPDHNGTAQHFRWLLQVAVTNLWRNINNIPWGGDDALPRLDLRAALIDRNIETEEFLTEWGDNAPGPDLTRVQLYELYITGKRDADLPDVSGQPEGYNNDLTVKAMKTARWSKSNITKERWRFIVGFMYKEHEEKPWPDWSSNLENQARLLAARNHLTEVTHTFSGSHLLKHHTLLPFKE